MGDSPPRSGRSSRVMAWAVGLVASVTCLAACTAPTTAPGKSTPAHLERVSCASFASLPATGTVETPAPYRVTPRLFVSSKSRYDRLDPAERTELQASLAAAMQRLGALHCPTTPPVRSVPSTAPPAGIGAAGTAVSSTTSTAGDPTATAYFGARAGALELWAGGADVATSVPCTTLFGVTACAGEAAACVSDHRNSRFSITESRDGRAPRFLAVSMAEEGSELEDPPLEMA